MSITIMRGYPGSGKTALAKQWIRDAPNQEKRARVSRDDIRASQFASDGVLPYATEEVITKLEREAVVRLVKGGYDVVVDDLNLRAKYARAWADLAVELGVEFKVWDVEESVETCKRRDYERMLAGGRYVKGEVIDDLGDKFPVSRWPEIKPTDKAATRTWPLYTPDQSLPKAYIVDIDGTIAAKQMGEGSRGWHEYHRVGEDLPKQVVIDIVRSLHFTMEPRHGVDIIFVSGRKAYCMDETRDWLAQHVGPWTEDCLLYMRGSDDNRADDLVKNEIFERDIAPHWNVLATIDDRQRVVDMWRAKGLTCLQVDAWEEAGK
jgi:predicted kinase